MRNSTAHFNLIAKLYRPFGSISYSYTCSSSLLAESKVSIIARRIQNHACIMGKLCYIVSENFLYILNRFIRIKSASP